LYHWKYRSKYLQERKNGAEPEAKEMLEKVKAVVVEWQNTLR
jgi:hypothetical protein